MASLTPRNSFSQPDEFEEPWFESAKGFNLGVDAAIYANAENSQLLFQSTGIVSWDATGAGPTTGVLAWLTDVFVTGYSTPFKGVIAGPASIELEDGEVLYFVMPRLLGAPTPLTLYRSNRIFLEGTRLHDLRLFAARSGTTVYFYDNKNMKDGDAGVLWGAGLNIVSIFPAHKHRDALVIQPPAAGISTLDIQMTAPALLHAYVYRNGYLQTAPDDYTLNTATGIVTLVIPTVVGERFAILREERDTTVVTSTHTHLSALKIAPLPATVMLDILVATPVLQSADLFRNGGLQVQPDDYSLDVTTGFVTLVIPTIAGENFQVLRRINI